jgi:hypothetical protein
VARHVSGAASVTSAASTGAPGQRQVGPPADREKRAHATSPRLAPPSCSTTRRVSRRSARPSIGSSEALRLNCVACGSSSSAATAGDLQHCDLKGLATQEARDG